MKYIMALDQGTTSCRAILFDRQGSMVGGTMKEFRQIYPRPGWVEHNPEEIWDCQLEVMRQVLKETDTAASDIAAIGITNQRETVVVWDRHTGRPVGNAVVWQCRRTAPLCEELKQMGLTGVIREKTGLIPDAYFSGTKIKWILDNTPGAKEAAQRGDLLAGTMDSWLLWKLTDGLVHATDYTNASRTMLYHIKSLCWDEELLKILDIPICMLPVVKDSSGFFGNLSPKWLGCEIPVTGIAGDQQSALFGQACFEPGTAKNTYGTGCFLLMHTGTKIRISSNNLLTTIAWGIGGKVEYALEGSVFVAGAAIQWLRDELHMIETAAQSEVLAASVADTLGVYLVPAFVGLGAPYWDMYARGGLLGLTRGVNRCHIVRAALESIAYQTKDILSAMEMDSGIRLKALKVDGGACVNNFLMQFQADILNTTVIRPTNTETTAQGAAFLSGLEVGFWQDKSDIQKIWQTDRVFVPQMDDDRRKALYTGWQHSVERCSHWQQPEVT